MPITHSKVSAVADSGDTGLVRPSDWNSTHSGGLDAWVITKSVSQTLTASTSNLITFDVAEVDSGLSVIDLANDRLVAPSTGLYLSHGLWKWEGTVPATTSTGFGEVHVGGGSVYLLRDAAGSVNTFGERSGFAVLSLTAGDLMTMRINPGTPSGVTCRGSSSISLRSKLTLIRLA